MAKIGVSLKIDVTKIDKSKLFFGEKGKYLDATVFIEIDEKDQYGNNGMIVESVSKEDKQNGVRGNILGNCKVFFNKSQETQQQGFKPNANNASKFQHAPPTERSQEHNFDDDINF